MKKRVSRLQRSGFVENSIPRVSLCFAQLTLGYARLRAVRSST